MIRILITALLYSIVVTPIECSEEKTGFEDCPSGAFEKLETAVGIWNEVVGKVLIDDKHARTGTKCLQIAGGRGSSVVLNLRNDIDTKGQLQFWAERWTRRSPFSFRIEKFSRGKWTEIYIGDDRIKVGRSFLTRVSLPLPDDQISKLRFSVTSPENTGILIDDLQIVQPRPQKVTRVEIVPVTLPALAGKEACGLVKLKVTVKGQEPPVTVTGITASLVNQTSCDSSQHVQMFYGGSNSNFRTDQPFSVESIPEPGKPHLFSGARKLVEGENYFWLGCKLAEAGKIDIDNTVAGQIDSISFSDGKTIAVSGSPQVQRMGIAIRNLGDDGVHTYRIPGLATTNSGSLIAVYDVRHDNSRDLPGNIDVGMSRSTDGGRTWEPMRIIMDMGNDPKWRGDGIGDPSILVDRTTGTVWVSATWSHGNRSWRGSEPGLEPEETGQWMLVKSEDDGVSWSRPINITKQVKKPDWSFFLQGPGKGITMSDGTLVFPAQYQDPPNSGDKRAHRLPHSTLIYSRDNGNSWRAGTGAWGDTTESQVVELGDGELLLNCRLNRSSKRAVLTTTDLGASWERHATHDRDLIEPGACMASMINVGRELGWRNIESNLDHKLLLFSNPDSLKGRNHMTIKASVDAGATWKPKNSLLLDEENSYGYSCMSMIDAETVGILYEGSQAQMTFQRIKIRDILNPPRNQKTRNPTLSPTSRPGDRSESLSVAKVFGDAMVLQAKMPIRIWGNTEPESPVSASFLGRTVTGTSDPGGKWMIELPAVDEYVTAGQPLMVSSSGKTVVLNDVLVGEVWFCAGQSNMEWPVAKTVCGPTALQTADDNMIRLLDFAGKVKGTAGTYNQQQLELLETFLFSDGSWQICSEGSVRDFSAVGYYFADKIRDHLDCPVGMISVASGGTPIESWISEKQISNSELLNRIVEGNWLENPELNGWCQGRARQNLERGLSGEIPMPGDQLGPNHSFKPGFMHAASVKPFQPMSIRGVLWYQGESNADTLKQRTQYRSAFPLLVKSWRTGFQNPAMPWIYVQLPSMNRPKWPEFREMQRRFLSELTRVGMAAAIDVGQKNDVHPKEKKPVGERLAAWALCNVYDQHVISSGPLYSGWSDNNGETIIRFDHVGDGLKTSDGKSPRHFEVASADGKFLPAKAEIVGPDQIQLTSPNVSRIRRVRYAWSPYPEPPVNLVNSANYPASPFDTE